MHIANNSWQLVNRGALAAINQNWQSMVMPEYNQDIFHHYPLNQDSDRDLDLSHFIHFFAHNGVLSRFYSQYLTPFINQKTTPWTLYQSTDHALQLKAKDLMLFQHLVTIENRYFDQNTHKPKLHFTITPRNLSSNASQAVLILGNKTLYYAHGPERPMSINWPLSEGMDKSKLLIRDFHGRAYIIQDTGPWSIYRLFAKGHLHLGKRSGRYTYHVTLGGHDISFNIISSADLSTLQLTALRHFYLPPNVIGQNYANHI